MYTPKTQGGILRKINRNKIQIMQIENDLFLAKKGLMFEEFEDIEDAKKMMRDLMEENKLLKDKLKEI